jgi:AcrR family transcriptional regulator
VATVQPPVDVNELFPRMFEGDLDGLGERVVGTFLSVWEHPVSGPAFEALLRNALTNRISATLMREFFTLQIQRRAVARLAGIATPEQARLRAALSASHMFGLAVLRYILKFEPLASLPREQVVAMVAPTIQRYLGGDLPHQPATVEGRPADPTSPGGPNRTGEISDVL